RRTGCKVIKALRVRSAADIQAAEAYRTDLHLLDAYRPGQPGGTGESFDWELLSGRKSAVPLILAGGLTPANVDQAIAASRPYAVDVASGVETGPGIKDHDLMAEFAARAQSTAPAEGEEAVSGAELERGGGWGRHPSPRSRRASGPTAGPTFPRWPCPPSVGRAGAWRARGR